MIVKRRLKIAGKSRVFRANQSWRNIAGRDIFFRSDWEYKFALHLQLCKENMVIEEWEYEPKTFWFEAIKRGTRSYLPDFRVTTRDAKYWVEVKGYFDKKSLTKIRRFRKYYPEEELKIIDSKWFKENDFKIPARTPMEKDEAPLSTRKRWIPNKRSKKGLRGMG